MVSLNSSDAIQRFVDDARLQSSQGIPTQLKNDIQPVFEINPRITRPTEIVKYASLSNATAANMYANTPSDKDFYITSASLSMIKDATATTTQVSINVPINGAATNLLTLPGITLTAQNQSISISFHHPLKVDRNGLIRVVSATNVANILAHAVITGYLAN